MSINKYNIIITGGGRGIGLELTKFLLKEGHTIICISKSLIANKNINNLNKLYKNKVFFYYCDLLSEKKINFISQKIIKKYKKIDILINNAGVHTPINNFHKNSFSNWVDTFKVNLFAPFLLTKIFFPLMVKNKFGRIINISGGGATKSMPYYSSYAASKSALIRFSETIADEIEQLKINITVNSIAPGFINTEIHQSSLKAKKIIGKYYNFTMDKLKSGGDDINKTFVLIKYLMLKKNKLNGRLISSIFDDLKQIDKSNLKKNNQLYKLRRVDNYLIYEKKT